MGGSRSVSKKELDRPAAPFSLPAFRWREARWLSPVALLLLWELGSRTGVIPTRILAAPSTVAETFWQMTLSGELPGNLAVSLARAAAGLARGLVFGVTLALVARLTRTGETAVDP